MIALQYDYVESNANDKRSLDAFEKDWNFFEIQIILLLSNDMSISQLVN